MATILNTTTSKGAGNYIGETKKQLRDGKISQLFQFVSSHHWFMFCVTDKVFLKVLVFIITPTNSSDMKESGARARNMVGSCYL